MNFDILLEQIGEDGVYALSEGLYARLKDDSQEIVASLSDEPVPSVHIIDEAIANLADLRVLGLQYAELSAALDKYAYPSQQEPTV